LKGKHDSPAIVNCWKFFRRDSRDYYTNTLGTAPNPPGSVAITNNARMGKTI